MDYRSLEYIIRYSNNIEEISKMVGFTYILLLANYAIIYIDEAKLKDLIAFNEILYVEPSRQFYYENIKEEYSANCMNISDVERNSSMLELPLTGKGIIAAVIDSGIDMTHKVFDNTVFLDFWDQTDNSNPIAPYNFGTIIKERRNLDNTGHGTSVAGIITECAPDSPILVVRLRGETEDSSNTVSIITAIDYCVRKSIELNTPMVINLSYGNNYGNHAGDSIIEKYIDDVSALAKVTFVVGMGNEGNTARHSQLMFGNTAWEKLEIIANEFLKSFTIQIWKDAADEIDFIIEDPLGNEIGPFNNNTPDYNNSLASNNISVIRNNPTQYNLFQEFFIAITGVNAYVTSGSYYLKFRPRSIKNGRVDMWLPVEAATSATVYFPAPSVFTSMTIPATASNAISVAAYNLNNLTYASFSGRGYSLDNKVKPDIAAPGVNINVPIPGNLYQNKSGTSFATPFVSAGCLMLMQWGITEGRDLFLYGNKLKNVLVRGARKLPGFMDYPNEYVGYGALCVSEAINRIF